MLIEKAWAKLHGCYAHIDGGLAREPLHDLTGAPARTYRPKVGASGNNPVNHYIWERIKDGELRDHAMCAGTILYPDGSKECKYIEFLNISKIFFFNFLEKIENKKKSRKNKSRFKTNLKKKMN